MCMPIYTTDEAVAYMVSTSCAGKRTLCDLEFIKYALARALVKSKLHLKTYWGFWVLGTFKESAPTWQFNLVSTCQELLSRKSSGGGNRTLRG
jgi:hypothetical protein